MDSRISIKGDFQRNTPFIEVIIKKSDDARDDMVKSFTEKFEHTNQWARIEWQVQPNMFKIYPISPEELERDIERMQETLRQYRKWQSENSNATANH